MTSDEFWVKEFGNRNEEYDFAGKLIRKNKYGTRTNCGWTLDHYCP
jgi:hypothetical protein